MSSRPNGVQQKPLSRDFDPMSTTRPAPSLNIPHNQNRNFGLEDHQRNPSEQPDPDAVRPPLISSFAVQTTDLLDSQVFIYWFHEPSECMVVRTSKVYPIV